MEQARSGYPNFYWTYWLRQRPSWGGGCWIFVLFKRYVQSSNCGIILITYDYQDSTALDFKRRMLTNSPWSHSICVFSCCSGSQQLLLCWGGSGFENLARSVSHNWSSRISSFWRFIHSFIPSFIHSFIHCPQVLRRFKQSCTRGLFGAFRVMQAGISQQLARTVCIIVFKWGGAMSLPL